MKNRTLVVVMLLVALTFLALGRAFAGPPEVASGRMVLLPDRVSEGLRQYRKEKARASDLAAQGNGLDPRPSHRGGAGRGTDRPLTGCAGRGRERNHEAGRRPPRLHPPRPHRRLGTRVVEGP